MKFFLDTEFIESGPGKPIQLISVGLVCENGLKFYGVSSEFNPADASDWVNENVLPYVGDGMTGVPLKELSAKVIDFVGMCCCGEKPEFWGYYADYDWVVFCQMFGSMIDLPKGWPMYCRDVKQWCDELGNPELPKQNSQEHNALMDAMWNKEAWKLLKGISMGAFI